MDDGILPRGRARRATENGWARRDGSRRAERESRRDDVDATGVRRERQR